MFSGMLVVAVPTAFLGTSFSIARAECIFRILARLAAERRIDEEKELAFEGFQL